LPLPFAKINKRREKSDYLTTLSKLLIRSLTKKRREDLGAAIRFTAIRDQSEDAEGTTKTIKFTDAQLRPANKLANTFLQPEQTLWK